MDLRRHLGEPPPAPPGDRSPDAGRPGLRPPQAQLAPRTRQATASRPSLADARYGTTKRAGEGTRRRGTPASNATATWISRGWYRLDLRYELIGEHPDGTIEVLTWPPFTVRADCAGLRARASGTSPVTLSLEVAANQPVEVRLTPMTLGGLIASLMGEKWGETLVVDNGGQVTTGPLPGHQQPTR